MNDRFETFTSYMLLLYRSMQKVKEKEMQQFGLHATHSMCLYYLSKHPNGLTSGQLTTLCKEDKAAISRSLKQLMEKEFVVLEKESDKKNYRGLFLLTDAGTKLASQIHVRLQQVLASLGNGISEEDRKHLYKVLEVIVHNFDEYLKN